MAIKQYPHYLFQVVASESTQDENGNFTNSEISLVFVGRCREETAGKGAELHTGGGTFMKYSSLIQLPRGTSYIKEGAEVLVCNDREGESIRIKGSVLKFDQGQLHSRLWL